MFRQSLVIFSFLICSSLCVGYFNTTIYTYKTIDDLKIEAIVYYPNYPSSEKYPVFLGLHGGGYINYGKYAVGGEYTIGSKMDALSVKEIYEGLSRGWVVVAIDYRLSPGAFLEDMIQDVQDAYTWIRTDLANRIPINPDLITVFGGSAGGGLALIAGYKLTPRPKAVIAFYPYCANFTDSYAYNSRIPIPRAIVAEADNLKDVISQYAASNPTDPRIMLFTAVLMEQKGGWLLTTRDPAYPIDKVMENLRNFSASENVDENFPPTYLAHGQRDVLVPSSQSVQMASALKEKNIPYVFDLVPGAEHGFDLLGYNPDIWINHVVPAFDFAQKYMVVKKASAQANTEFLSK